MAHTELLITSITNKGIERDHNEDYHGFIPDFSTSEWVFWAENPVKSATDHGSLLIVADGMGGTNAGEVAAQMAVESIRDYFLDKKAELQTIGDEKIKSLILQGIDFAQNNLISHQITYKETEGMGTTLVVSLILKNKAYIAWVGDSRMYLFNNNGLIQLSHDHSYVQELVDAGKITAEQAFYHPQSNIITQSLGDAKRPPKPGFFIYNLQKDDVLLICSDGLNSMITDADIQHHMQAGRSMNELGTTLIKAANNAGGHDNITVMLAHCVQIDNPLPPNPPKSIKTIPANIHSPEIETAQGDSENPSPFRENNSRKIITYILGVLTILLLGFIIWQNYPAIKNLAGIKNDSTVLIPPKKDSLKAENPAKTIEEKNQPDASGDIKPSEKTEKHETPGKKENLVEENKKKTLVIEEKKWKEAKQKGTISAYKEFLKIYQTGVYADSAKAKIKMDTEKFAPITDSLNYVLKKFDPPSPGPKSTEFKKELEQCISYASEGILEFVHLQRLFSAHAKLSGYTAPGMQGVKKETFNLFDKDPVLTRQQ